MKTFKDNTGRTWSIVLDVSAGKRLRDLCGVDLLRITDKGSTILADLGNDPIKLVDCIYAALKPDVDAAGLTDEQFGRALAGDAIDLAAEAFMEELPHFFLKRQRTLVSDALAKVDQAAALVTARGRKAIAAIDVEKIVSEHLAEPTGATSTNSPA